MKTLRQILVSTSSFGVSDKGPLNTLKRLGVKVTLNPYQRTLKTQELISLLKGRDLLIAGTEKITEDVFKENPSLRIISRCGSGMDSIDLKAAQRYKVKVVATPDAPVQSVAELTLALTLDLLRGIAKSDRKVRSGGWSKEMGRLLINRNVGIVGFGKIGQQVAKIFKPLVKDVVFCDARRIMKTGFKQVTLTETLRISDVLTIHLPHCSSTHNMFGAVEFKKMKKEAVLINTSRGGIIDEKALFQALKKNLIKGAALDVFENEPYHGPLSRLDNVLMTPHIGSYTKETRVMMEHEAVQHIVDFIKVNK